MDSFLRVRHLPVDLRVLSSPTHAYGHVTLPSMTSQQAYGPVQASNISYSGYVSWQRRPRLGKGEIRSHIGIRAGTGQHEALVA
jgi:hypothetical protein